MQFWVNGHVGDSFQQIDRVVLSWHPRDKDRELFSDSENDYLTPDPGSDMVETIASALQRQTPNANPLDIRQALIDMIRFGDGDDAF